MNRQELIALLFDNMNSVTVLQGTYNLLAAFFCAVIVYTVYHITSKEVRPTASFAVTILIVTLSTCLILMLIGSNLALSLGMVGALSIIRFRSAVKDTRDASFIFYTIAAGMTSALGIYALAFVGTLLIGVVIVLFSFLNIGSQTFILTIRSSSFNPLVEEELIKITRNRYTMLAVSLKSVARENILLQETTSHEAHQATNQGTTAQGTTSQEPTLIEIVYEISLKKGTALLYERLLQEDGVVSVNAVLREDV